MKYARYYADEDMRIRPDADVAFEDALSLKDVAVGLRKIRVLINDETVAQKRVPSRFDPKTGKAIKHEWKGIGGLAHVAAGVLPPSPLRDAVEKKLLSANREIVVIDGKTAIHVCWRRDLGSAYRCVEFTECLVVGSAK